MTVPEIMHFAYVHKTANIDKINNSSAEALLFYMF